jgi:hypothetical protein
MLVWRRRGQFYIGDLVENRSTMPHTFYYGRLFQVTQAEIAAPPKLQPKLLP